MNDLGYIVGTFGKMLAENPTRLLPFLAFACAVTVIIAITTDALFRRRLARAKKADDRSSIRR